MIKLTDDVRKALRELGTSESLAILHDLEEIEKTKKRTPPTKKSLPQTTFHEVMRECQVCGEPTIQVMASINGGIAFHSVRQDTYYPITSKVVGPEIAWCEQCMADLDDVPRSNLVWIVEQLLEGTSSKRGIEVLKKGLGWDEAHRDATKQRRVVREYPGADPATLNGLGLKSKADSFPKVG